jgi:hypothetical protein
MRELQRAVEQLQPQLPHIRHAFSKERSLGVHQARPDGPDEQGMLEEWGFYLIRVVSAVGIEPTT